MIMMINPELNLSRYKRMKAIHKDGFLLCETKTTCYAGGSKKLQL